MHNLLILYASKGGSTAEVVSFMANLLQAKGLTVDIANAEQFTDDIYAYDAIILGSPIYKGVWMSSLWRTVRRLEPQFKDKPVWGFSLCARVLEPAGYEYAEHYYLPHNVLDKLNLRDYQFFSGRMQNLSVSQKAEFFTTYDGFQGRIEGDYRNWGQIGAWTQRIAEALEPTPAG